MKGIIKFNLLIFCCFLAIIGILGTPNFASAKEPSKASTGDVFLPDTHTVLPKCCLVKYDPILFSKNLSTLSRWIENTNGPFQGKCTDQNTYYERVDRWQGFTKVPDNPDYSCFNDPKNCRAPTYLEVANDFWGLDFGGVSVALYYSPETKVYGEFLTEWRDAGNPVKTNDANDNRAYPDKCLPDLHDDHAKELFGDGAPCAYMVCGIDGYWSSPASLEFTETCTLNPLFRFYDDPQTGLLQTEGISTAIGCFPSTPEGVVTAILRIVMGVAGLIAIGIIISGFVAIMTSGDNPEKVKESYSKITYAALGLLLLVLSVFILRFIGITILNLPNFNI